MVVWKFRLSLTEEQTIELPGGATILSTQNQGGQICLWAIVNPEQEKVAKRIAIIGTGNPMPSGVQRFIGTVLMTHFVWHIFECE